MTTSILERAYAAVEYQDQSKLFARRSVITKQLSKLPAIAEIHAANENLSATAAAALRGELGAHDIMAAAERIIEARRISEIVEMANDVLTAQVGAAKADSVGLEAKRVNKGLAVIAAALAELVDRVRVLATDLGGIESLEDAVASGSTATSTWRALQAAVTEYADIRDAQAKVTLLYWHPTRNVNGMLPRMGFLADALDVDAEWADVRRAAAHESPATSVEEKDWRDWLEAATIGPRLARSTEVDDNGNLMPTREFLPRTGKELYLMSICTQAHPWVPSVDQLVSAMDAAAAATQPTHGNGRTDDLTAARERYYELTRMHPDDAEAA